MNRPAHAPFALRFVMLASSTVLSTMFCLAALAPSTVHAEWDPFHRPNPNVEEGNERMAAENWDGALEAYADAANELPEERGVRLNRGLALMARGDLAEAEQAFMSAIIPPVDDAVRADTYYNLGLLRYRQGDAAATDEDHSAARQHFEGAVGHFRRALRARPGNRDAGWNLELALRRLVEQREEEEREREEQEQQQDGEDGEQGDQGEQDQQQQQQDQQDQEQDDQQQNGDGEQDDNESSEDEQQPSPDNQDPDGDDDGQEGNEDSEDEQPAGPDGEGEDAPPETGDEEQPAQPQDGSGGGGQAEDEQSQGSGQRLPENVQRQLDALQDGEQSLERYRAAARGRQAERRVEHDW